jgi:hypothetical protein
VAVGVEVDYNEAMARLQFGVVGCSYRLHTAKVAPAKCSADNVSQHPAVAQTRVGTRNGPVPNVQTPRSTRSARDGDPTAPHVRPAGTRSTG